MKSRTDRWWPLALGAVLALALAGCASKDKGPQAQQPGAPFGPMQTQEPAQPQAQVVHFRGFVRKPVVAWTEGLTLAEALLEAEYTGIWNPHLITITRKGELLRINPRRLLSGLENPLLQPGDLVEVQR